MADPIEKRNDEEEGKGASVPEPSSSQAEQNGRDQQHVDESVLPVVDDDQEADSFDDAEPPSARVADDFVPQEAPAPQDVSYAQVSSLVPCPQCSAELEPWQITCHRCGRVVSSEAIPNVVQDQTDKNALQDAFASWYKRGVEAMQTERYSEAQICFVESLSRLKAIEHGVEREVELRKQLCRALEKLDKRAEASEQYVILGRLTKRSNDEFEKRARELSMSTADVLARVETNSGYRAPEGRESKLVPLYCSSCKQLLVEAEVHGYRNARSNTVRCFCGFEGPPLARVDSKHFRALKLAPVVRSQRALLLQAAAEQFPEGHKKDTAILLAVVTGWCGGHRFYLGHRAEGIAYALLCWTFIPLIVSLFEALNYAQMSRVTFNLMYNIELVLAKLPELQDKSLSVHEPLFDMETGEQPPDPEDVFEEEEHGAVEPLANNQLGTDESVNERAEN